VNSIRAGLLTSGSSYRLRLPISLEQDSGLLQVSSPVTAAGPCRFYTGFPIMPYMGTRIN